MTDLRKAAEKYIRPGTIVDIDIETTATLVDLLRQALAPQKWVGLTEEEFSDLLYFDGRLDHVEVPLIADFIQAIQAKLKEKNT